MSEKGKNNIVDNIVEISKVKIITLIITFVTLLLAAMTAFVTSCDFLEKIGFDWCPEIVVPEPNPKETARELFDKKSTNLQVKIDPTPPLKIGQEASLHITNNSNEDAYFLAFSVDNEGQLFSFVHEIANEQNANKLKLEWIPEYLKVYKGQTVIIPQPDVPKDPLAGIIISGNIGQELLVVILVNKLSLDLIDILILESEVQPIKILENLHNKLESSVEDIEYFKWSSVIIDYEIISSQIN